LHLEAIADGAAGRQRHLRALERHPRAAAPRQQLVLEVDTVVGTEREVGGAHVELGGRAGAVGELEDLTQRPALAGELEARRGPHRRKAAGIRAAGGAAESEERKQWAQKLSHGQSSSISKWKSR